MFGHEPGNGTVPVSERPHRRPRLHLERPIDRSRASTERPLPRRVRGAWFSARPRDASWTQHSSTAGATKPDAPKRFYGFGLDSDETSPGL